MLRDWYSEYEKLGRRGEGTFSRNQWEWYDAYLFSFSVASYTGFWYHSPATAVGKVMVMLWGLPAMVIGIMSAMVISRVAYLALWGHLRFWSCGRRPRTLSRWEREARHRLVTWRDTIPHVIKYVLLLLLLLLTMGCGLVQLLIASEGASEEGPTEHNYLEVVYFAYNWATTLGIGELRTECALLPEA